MRVSADTVLRPTTQLVGAPLDDEYAALDPDSGSVFLFNPPARAVFALLDGRRTVGEVCEALSAQYASPQDLIYADVVSMLEPLVDSGLFDVQEPSVD
jgi:hypothetical protein